MPVYFFDLIGPSSHVTDDVGIDFGDADIAYLEARRSIIDLSSEMVRDQIDPHQFRFEIRDEAGLITELRFLEVLRPIQKPPASPLHDIRDQLRRNRARNDELRRDIAAALDEARATMTSMQDRLRRRGPRHPEP
jgi:hypothetical protein